MIGSNIEHLYSFRSQRKIDALKLDARRQHLRDKTIYIDEIVDKKEVFVWCQQKSSLSKFFYFQFGCEPRE